MKTSNKSVIEKLNFKKFQNRLILNRPNDIDDFEAIDYDNSIKNEEYDLIFAFIFSLDEFFNCLNEVIEKKLVKDNGYLYFAYPKKGNPQYEKYIERDDIYTEKYYNEEGFFPNSNLKFSRVISLNDVFTVVGIKSVSKKIK